MVSKVFQKFPLICFYVLEDKDLEVPSNVNTNPQNHTKAALWPSPSHLEQLKVLVRFIFIPYCTFNTMTSRFLIATLLPRFVEMSTSAHPAAGKHGPVRTNSIILKVYTDRSQNDPSKDKNEAFRGYVEVQRGWDEDRQAQIGATTVGGSEPSVMERWDRESAHDQPYNNIGAVRQGK